MRICLKVLCGWEGLQCWPTPICDTEASSLHWPTKCTAFLGLEGPRRGNWRWGREGLFRGCRRFWQNWREDLLGTCFSNSLGLLVFSESLFKTVPSHVRLFTAPWIAATRLLCPWNFPGKNTGVGCYILLQEIFRPRDQTHVSCIGRQILYCYPNFLFFIGMNLNWHVDVISIQVFSGLFTWPRMAKYCWMGTHSCAINIGFEASSATSWQRLSFHVAEMGVIVFHQGIGMKGVIIWKLPHSSLRHSIPACEVASVLSDSLQHYGLYPSRLLCPWGFSRQEYWSGLLCPPPGDLANSGTEPTSLKSPALAGRFFTTSATWEVLLIFLVPQILTCSFTYFFFFLL